MPYPRVLHLADIHLGTELYGKVNPATGLSTRVADFLSCLDQALDHALGLPVDAVLVCGDIFKSRDPSPTYQREFALRVRRVVEAGIPICLLAGNHDLPLATGRASAVDIFAALAVPRVHVIRRPGVQVVETARGPLQIAALPWVTRSTLLLKDDYRNRTLDEINQATAEKIEHIMRDMVARLDKGLPSVLMAHASVMGATFGSERSVMLGQDIVLAKSVLADAAFDYVALGHVHRHQVLSTRPLMIYSGSLERIDFGEEKEEKGYVIAEVRSGGAEYAFHPVAARRFTTVEVTAEGDDPLAQVLESIARAEVGEAVVRVRVRTTEEKEPLLLESEIRKALRDAHHVAGVSRIVERRSRSRWSGHALQEMTPGQALAAYVRHRGFPEPRAKSVLQLGEVLIRERPL